MNTDELRDRFLLDSVSVRLGNLSSSLARIANLARLGYLRPLPGVLREAAFFIEWSAPDTRLEVQATLARVQVQLALWWLRWQRDEIPSLPEVEHQCREWADWVLSQSGLLEPSNA